MFTLKMILESQPLPNVWPGVLFSVVAAGVFSVLSAAGDSLEPFSGAMLTRRSALPKSIGAIDCQFLDCDSREERAGISNQGTIFCVRLCSYPVLGQQEQHGENTVAVKPVRPAYQGSLAPAWNKGQVQTGLGGYSCVRVIQSRAWVKGDREFASMYRGVRYRFANQTELNQFIKFPQRYVPALQGDCLVSWVQDSAMVPGSTQFAAIYRNRIYLFSSQERKLEFMQAPEKFAPISSGSTATGLQKLGQGSSGNQGSKEAVAF